MTFRELERAVAPFVPALIIDGVVFRGRRDAARRVVEFLTGGVFILFTFYAVIRAIPALSAATRLDEAIFPYLPLLEGGLYFFLAVLLTLFSIEAFYRSHYFSDLSLVLPEGGEGAAGVSFEAALALWNARPRDVSASFIASPIGREFLARLGIPPEHAKAFLSGARSPLDERFFRVEPEEESGVVTLAALAEALFSKDEDFRHFLSSHGLSQVEVVGAARFVERLSHRARVRARWWGKDELGRIPGIGKDWAYGGGWSIGRYATPILEHPAYRSASEMKLFRHEVEQAEGILSRAREANVILVGPDGETLLGVVALLGRMIAEGRAFPQLEHKRIIVFNGAAFVAATKTKAAFEAELLKVFADAEAAGNLIVCIPDLSGFLESAHAIGADVPALLDPYLASRELQVIGLSTTDSFHAGLEPNISLMGRFDRVLIREPSESGIIRAIEDSIQTVENRAGVVFTYPAIVALAKSVEQYFGESEALDKVEDLIGEIAPRVRGSGKTVVTKEEVQNTVSLKTGIPTGEVTAPEAEKLLKLEAILHERIVGQDEAVRAISNALRRARSGLANPRRPMGSFLFLGPTGVGKTETTKALAAVFFGGESAIIRIDMSEYKGVDAMDKLIGSFTTKRPGVLSSAIRERPYGVLLLDEFEKASRDVLDLFLQVLDEGFFSDASGKKVGVRNTIIVATSNAGADLIWEILRRGESLAGRRDEIVDALVKSGAFKPELLNRFDGVILFHPIVGDDLRAVAKHLLAQLAKRLSEKGIELVVTETLIEYLVRFGSDPKFGARPMNRAIQDKVEQVIAEKMIKGELKPGQKVELTLGDLETFLQGPTGADLV